MQFVYPGFLFALTTLLIPVIIHLFNFRRFKKIAFTNVQFLREIKQDTRSRSRLKHLLILIARLLAVTFLVLAFAQPFIPEGNKMLNGKTKSVGIYIDNSFSMDAVGKSGSLLETAKRKAREIALAFQPSDHFQLLTNDFEARHQRTINREEFLQLVDEVKSSSSVKSLSEVVTRQSDALKGPNVGNLNISLYEISDYQKTVTDIEKLINDTTLSINLVPLTAATENNLYIDSCFLSTPFVQLNAPNELTVSVVNISDNDAESVPVKLFINGSQRSLASMQVPARSKAVTRLTFAVTQPGWQQAKVAIADYPVVFDDEYYFSFEVKENLSILCINEIQPSPYVEALFGKDPYFKLKNATINQVDYSSFISHNLIVLNNLNSISSGLLQELRKYLEQGGAAMLFPSPAINVSSYGDFFKSFNLNAPVQFINDEGKVSFIEKNSPLFADVFEKKNNVENIDYPAVTWHYNTTPGTRSKEETLMKLQNGDPFFSTVSVEKGRLYICYSPLDDRYSNFPRHALFVPMMLKAAMSGFNSFQNPQIIGANLPIEIPAVQLTGENLLHLSNSDQKFDIIPETRMVNNKPMISTHNQVQKAGNYSLTAENKLLSVISYNFDRRESDLVCLSEEELKDLAGKAGLQSLTIFDGSKELTNTIEKQNEGTRLWKYCILIALLFLGCEVLLIRFMSSQKKTFQTANTHQP